MGYKAMPHSSTVNAVVSAASRGAGRPEPGREIYAPEGNARRFYVSSYVPGPSR